MALKARLAAFEAKAGEGEIPESVRKRFSDQEFESLKQIFKAADANKNGTIEPDEVEPLIKEMASLGTKVSQAQITKSLRRFKHEESGLNFAKFIDLVDTVRKKAAAGAGLATSPSRSRGEVGAGIAAKSGAFANSS